MIKNVLRVLFICLTVNLFSWGFAIKPIEKFQINDVDTYYYHNDFLPQIDIRLVIELGSIDYPEKPGLLTVFTRALTLGTKEYTKNELNEMLEKEGINLNVGVDKEKLTISIKTLKEDLDLALQALRQVLYFSVFPNKELQMLKDELIGTLKLNGSDPNWLARRKFEKAVYANSPYSIPVQGTVKYISKIQKKDLFEVYNGLFRSRNWQLVVVGDIDKDYLSKKMTPLFEKKLIKQERPVISVPKPVIRTHVISKNLVQANVFLGSQGVTRANRDYYNLQVLNEILGGSGLDSVLAKEIREKAGLTYSIYSHFETNKYCGIFYINFQTKTASEFNATDLVYQQVNKFRSGKISKKEFEIAKNHLIDSFPLRIETNSQIADYIVYIAHYGLPLNYFEFFPNKISKVKLVDVKKVANKYLPNSFLKVVVR